MNLSDALQNWRRLPHPDTAQTVRRIDEKTRRHAPKIQRNQVFHDTWIETFDSGPHPADVTWLASTLDHKPLQGRKGPTRARMVWFADRWERLRTLAPDPRVANALTRVVRRAKLTPLFYDSGVDWVYGSMLDHLVDVGDVSVLGDLYDLAKLPTAKSSTIRDYIARRLPAVLFELEERAPPDWRPSSTKGSKLMVESLAMVVADPHNPSSIAVFADALMELDEERAEFINCQLHPSPERDKRASSLLRAHAVKWLGPLERVLGRVVFKNGFLWSAALRRNSAAAPSVWAAASVHPELAHLHTMRRGAGSQSHLRMFLGSPHATGLRVVSGLTRPVDLERLLALDSVPPLNRIELSFRPRPTLQDRVRQRFERCDILVTL